MTDQNEWDDDTVDERIRALAREYHRPEGTVPREAMWTAIAASARAEQSPSVMSRRTVRVTRWRWGAALAAGLLIGVALDRGVVSRFGGTRTGAADAARTVARHDEAPVARVREVQSATEPARVGAGERAAATAISAPEASPGTTRIAARPSNPARPVTTVRGDAHDSAVTTASEPLSSEPPAQSLYRLAAMQTLTQAEALLTSYRSARSLPRDKVAIRQAARWAREVLTSTRLLLDSPASADPQLRALFSDLELVLVQIVQLSGAPLEASERELIERTMRDRDLLPRIRSAVPPGQTSS